MEVREREEREEERGHRMLRIHPQLCRPVRREGGEALAIDREEGEKERERGEKGHGEGEEGE